MIPRVVSLAGMLLCAAMALCAQTPIRGRVVALENGQALAGVSVYARRSRRSADSDRYGRFVVWLAVLPDTLLVRFIGRVPQMVPVADTSGGEIVIRLALAAVPLASVVVQGQAGSRPDDGVDAATWALPKEAVAAVPGAVEGDVFRGLVLSPAIGYSTPLSSQPFIRGTDPGAVSYRLDGFTVINPFHVGRIFSALMPEAVQGVRLAAAPFDVEYGDATSGIIDAQLHEGGDTLRGGIKASLVSAAAWAGGPAKQHRWFVAWRHGFLEHLGGPLRNVPYHFNDLYGRFAIAAPWGPVNVTTFWSDDRIFHRETNEGVGWSNALLGVRAPLALGRSGRLEVWGETSRFRENVRGLPIRGEDTDVRNRFETSATGARFLWTGVRTALAFSAELRSRRMLNEIESGTRAAPSNETAGAVTAITASVERRASRFAARLGLRADIARDVQAWQPRARLGFDLGRRWSVGVAAGRTARLYHIINEVLPDAEEILSIYDLWRPAGQNGTPLAAAIHALIELKRVTPSVSLRTSLYASRLSSVGEVRGSVLQASSGSFFRFGTGRVAGVDAEAGFSGSRRSLVIAYVLSWSRRTWDSASAPEIPWRYDRRHQARAFASLLAGHGWRFNLLAEAASPDPITPALGTWSRAVLLPDGTLLRNAGPALLVYGDENSARGGWMGHLDIGLQKQIGGPGRSVGHIGIAVLNLAFTPVAPGVPDIDFDVADGPRVVYRPRLFLPPIPTVTLSFEF